MTEVEILDDHLEPRDFNKSIVELREKMVTQMQGDAVLDVIDDINDLVPTAPKWKLNFYPVPFSEAHIEIQEALQLLQTVGIQHRSCPTR